VWYEAGLGRAYGGSGPDSDSSSDEDEIEAASLDSLAACASTQGKCGCLECLGSLQVDEGRIAPTTRRRDGLAIDLVMAVRRLMDIVQSKDQKLP